VASSAAWFLKLLVTRSRAPWRFHPVQNAEDAHATFSSVVLDLKRGAVREAAGRYRAVNPRVFGSVAHGLDRDGSDLDLPVDALPGATLFDLGGLQDELESLLGIHVDLLTRADLPPKLRAKVLAQARPV
jgi:hypothetical protein